MSDVVKLAGEDVGVLRDKSGEIRAFKVSMVLSLEANTLVKISKDKWKGNELVAKAVLTPTADAYHQMAALSGLLVRNAPTVVVNGVDQKNPHIETDKNGRVKRIHAAAFCWGLNAMGALSISERVIVYDLDQYRAVDLLAKIEYNPNVFRIVSLSEKVDPLCVVYPVDDVVGVSCLTTSGEFRKFMTSHINREKNAVTTAQTFAQRNAVKSHPSIKFHKTTDLSVTVPLMCWRVTKGSWPGLNLPNIGQSIEIIAGIAKGGNQSDKAEVQTGVDTVSVEEESAGDAQPAEQEEGQTGGGRDEILKTIDKMGDANPEAYQMICDSFKVKWAEGETPERLTDVQLVRFLEALRKSDKKEVES